jgi:hypothetical protein
VFTVGDFLPLRKSKKMVAKTLVLAGTALLAAFWVAGPAAAQQRAAASGGPNGSVIFNMIDKNRDGVVDKGEATAGAEAAFAAVDRNNDGRLSRAEVAAAVRNFGGRAALFAFGNRGPAYGPNGNRGPAFNNRGGAPRWYDDGRGQGQRSFDNRRNDRRFAPDNRRGQPFYGQPYPGPRFGQPNGPQGPQFQPPFQGNQPPFAPRFNRPFNGPGPQQNGPNGFGPRNRGNLNPPTPGPRGPQGPQGQLAPQLTPTPPTPPLPPAPQNGPAGPGNDGRTPAFNALDTNHDGVISPDEFNAVRGRLGGGPLGRGPLGQ